MTIESGANTDADDNSPKNPGVNDAGKAPARKVAKTMMDGVLPNLPEDSTSPETPESQETPKSRRVAKTMLEFDRPSEEEIIAASAHLENAQKPERKVPKTMMDIPRPNQSTEQEADRGSLAGDAARAVSKTMLEITLPAQSDTLKQVKRSAKTMLDVNSLDAIGMAKALKEEKQNVAVKVRKTLTSERVLPDFAGASLLNNQPTERRSSEDAAKFDDTNTVVSAHNQQKADNDFTSTQPTQATQPAQPVQPSRKKTRGTERFVAKTMLDHSVLSEQLVKSHEKEKVKAAYIAQERASEPPKERKPVDTQKHASPCAWNWDDAGGNKGRVRACDKCQTKVYDLNGLEMPEAESLIFKHESKKKFQLYKRADGKFMTSDCPVQAQRKRNLLLLCLVGAAVIICALAVILLLPPQAPPPSAVHEQTPPESSSSNKAVGETNNKKSSTTSSADGKIHFEATNAESQQSPNPGFFPTVTDPKPVRTPAVSPTSPTTPGTSSAPVDNHPSQADVKDSSVQDSATPAGNAGKYWDDGK